MGTPVLTRSSVGLHLLSLSPDSSFSPEDLTTNLPLSRPFPFLFQQIKRWFSYSFTNSTVQSVLRFDGDLTGKRRKGEGPGCETHVRGSRHGSSSSTPTMWNPIFINCPLFFESRSIDRFRSILYILISCLNFIF